MGRIRTQAIKAKTNEIIKLHGALFNTSFSENKNVLRDVIKTPSKKQLNLVAGYITRLKKIESEI